MSLNLLFVHDCHPKGDFSTFPNDATSSKTVPFAIPQLTIGSVLGTNLTVRYFCHNLNDDFGNLSLFGWGVKHSISQYLPMMPLDIAAAAYFQNYKIGNYASANGYIVNLQVLEGNQASSVNLSGSIVEGETEIMIFEDFPLSLAEGNTTVFLTDLNENGVLKLTQTLDSFLTNPGCTGAMDLDIHTNAGDQEVHAKLEVSVSGSITYLECKKGTVFMFYSGEEC